MRHSTRRPYTVLVGAALWLAVTATPARGQTVEAELKARIETMRVTGVLRLNGTSAPASELIAAVYERRAFAPLWLDPARRAALRVALTQLHDDGLDPAHYSLPALLAAAEVGDADEVTAQAARDDLLHTHALLLAGQHLRYGSVLAESLGRRNSVEAPLIGTDAVAAAERLLALDPLAALTALRPDHYVYRGMTDALRRLRQIQRAGGWAAVPAGTLRRDTVAGAVVLLRRRLRAEGDLSADADTTSPLFDGTVEEAVRAFQHRHALNTDGVVGPVTHRELAVPLATRIDQVTLNLERARWLLHDLPATFVTVNIAGALVYYIRDGVVVFEARTVVGKAATRTPVFSALMYYVDLNPTWTVPPGIVHEVLNIVRRDPAYLRTHDFRVLDAAGHAVPLSSIDFSRYSARSFPYVFRQQPGPLNPLGKVKLSFPNRYNVYLHDTSSPQLFERDERTFSHGCIRVQHPLRLAELVLDDPAWDAAALDAAIATGRTRTIQLRRPLPVLVQYWTAATDRHGELHFYRDVYSRDDTLLRALRD